MKKLTLLLLILLFLIGCDKKNKIEVLPNYAVEYLDESKVTQQAKPKIDNFEKVITEEFKKVIKEINSKSDQSTFLYPVGYKLYIGKNGKINKVEKIEAIEIEPKGTYIFNNENLLMDEVTEKMLPIMEEWEFESAKLFNENIGMQKNIKALFALDNGEVIVKKPFNLSFDNFESTFFVAVEQMPTPIGGIGAIQKNIVYPEIAKRAGIEGRVFVKAFIDTLGNVVKTEIIRGIGAGCDEASMEAVKKVKFKPGIQRGKHVNTQVTVPILFKLDESVQKTDNSDQNHTMKITEMDGNMGGLTSFQGRIVTMKEGFPIEAVKVTFKNTKYSFTTDQYGGFYFLKIPSGEYHLVLVRKTYGKYDLGQIKLNPDKNSLALIELTKNN